MTEMIG